MERKTKTTKKEREPQTNGTNTLTNKLKADKLLTKKDKMENEKEKDMKERKKKTNTTITRDY